jgi:HprK-related kinase A
MAEALLGSMSLPECRRRLASPAGLHLRTGPFAASLHSRIPAVAASVHALYTHHPVPADDAFVDFSVAVKRPAGLRQWWQPQVSFELEGHPPFNPLPGDQGFPLLEWGLNWCVYGLCNQYLILHAAVLERNGRALVLPAPSGSGKSTLCAGLLFHGWRLLSDELALIRPDTCQITPIPRPVSLKNASIEVIRSLVPGVAFGSSVTETSKGTVAHFAPPADAVARASELALPGWVVLPQYVAGQAATLQPLPKAQAFMHLIENAFNYDVFGAEGFQLLSTLVDRSSCWTFDYGHLPEAIALFDRLATAPGAGAA